MITIFLSSSTIKYKPSFRLGINTGYYPIFYENSYNSLITSLDFGIFTAITINKFSFGVEISDLYYSYNSQNENNRLTGAYNTLNSSLILFYSPIKYLELKFGLGGSWFKSAFYYSNSNITSKNEGGITFLLDGYFYMPFKYINFEQKNSLSLFIHDNGLTPLYSGIVRINFKPYFEWINLYLEVGAKTFFYNENETKIESGSFVWGIGVNFDIKFSKFNKSRKRIILDTTTDILKNNDSSDDLKGSPSNTTDNTDDIKKQSNSKKDQKTELLTNNTPETSNDQNRESLTAEVIKSEIDILKEQIINKFNNLKRGIRSLKPYPLMIKIRYG